MKKINLIEMLQGCSKRNGTAVYASNPDGQPTVNRRSRLTSYPGEMNEKEQMSSTCPRFALVLPSFCSRLDSLSLVSRQSDLDQVRAISVGLSARVWKHVAMIFAVLVMSMANIGMAWGKTWNVSLSGSGVSQDGITLTGDYAANASVGSSSKKANSFNTNNSSAYIFSEQKNITAISFTVCRNTNGASANNAVTVATSTGGAFAVQTSNFTATNNGSSISSLTNIQAVGNNQANQNTIVITFADGYPVQAVELRKASASLIFNISVTYEDETLPSSIFNATISGSTPAATVTPAGTSLTLSVNSSSPKTIGSDKYYQWNGDNVISLGSGKFQAGDIIIADVCGSGNNKAAGFKVNGGSTEYIVTFSASSHGQVFYTVSAGDGVAGQSSVTLKRKSSDTYVHAFRVLRYGAAPEPECDDVAAPTSLTCSAQTQTSLTYTWSKASHASTYTAKLYSDSGCESEVKSSDLGDVATVTFSDLTAGTTYYCKVQSHGDGSTYCAEGGTTSAASGTTSACTAISPTWSYPFSTVAVGITIYPTIGGNTGGGAVTYSSSATGKIANDCYATAAGSATITATVAANGAYCSGSVTSGTITVVADQSGLIKQTLTTGDNAWGTPSAPATTDGTNITSTTVLSATNLTISGNGNTSNGGQTAKITGMTAGSEGDNSGKYMRMGFTVKSGKQLNVSAIYIPVQPVSSDVNNIKAVLTDGETTITGTLTNSKNGKLAYIKFDSYGTVKGDVTLTLYAWGWTGGYRLGKSIVIDGEIEDAPSSCTAPNHVDISGNYHFFPGETLALTATAYSTAGTSDPIAAGDITGYQWQKYIGSDWADIVGETSATYTKANATTSDVGQYRCIVSTGATCSTTSGTFNAKCLQLYVYWDNKSDKCNLPFTKVDGTHATVNVSLENGSYTYYYKVTDGCGNWWGNTGTMTSGNCSGWNLNVNNHCGLTTTKAAAYTFNLTYNAGVDAFSMSVVYPSSVQVGGYNLYFANDERNWSNIHYRIGRSNWNSKAAMTLVPGTANLYQTTTIHYENDGGFEAWHIANNGGWSDGNSIYKTKTGDGNAITNATSFEGSPVPSTGLTVIPGSDHSTGGDDQNNNCEFYSYTTVPGMLTRNVSITAPSNGTISVAYTDVAGTSQSFTSGNRDLAHTVIITPTATPAEGYTLSGLTVNGAAHTSGNTYTVTANTTIAATFSPASYTVTLNTNGGTINAGNVTSYTYGTGATLPTNVTKSGFTFDGWYDNSGLTGSAVTTISTTATGNKEYWAKWTAAASLTALVANTLYEVPDMIPSGKSLTSSDQFFDGLSANTKFELIGSGSGSTTPKVNNNSSNDKTIDGITFDDGSMWFKGSATLSSNIPTTFGLSFIVPEGGGKLYLYFSDSGTSTNIKLAKSGSSGSKPTLTNGFAAVDVTAGTYYLYGIGTSSPYSFYGLKLVTCTTPAAPTAFSAGSITSTGATFSITDGGDAASYDIYYSTSSTAPTASTPATTTSTSKTKAVTGLTASTTYYAWVRSVCDADHKSAWVALSGSSFTTTSTPAVNDGCWDPANTAADKLTSGDVSLTTFDNNFSSVAGITSVTIQSKGASDGQCSGADEGTPSGYMKVKNASSSGVKIITIVTSAAKDITIGGEQYGSNTGSFYLVKSTNESTKLADCNTGATAKATNCPAGTYYVYAKGNSSKSINFSLLCIEDAAPCSTVPTVSAGSNSAVTSTTATVSCTGGITSLGTGGCTITSYGFVLGTSANPTTSNTTYEVGTTYTTTGTSFSKDLTGLTASTTYYVRPYATNGQGTAYGTQTSFTTSAPPVLHDVTFSLTNVVYSSGNNQGTGAATEGSAFSTVFAASSGYSLPGTITVTIGGVAQTAGTGYTWAQGSGTLTIPAAYVTDDIVVTIVGEELEGDGCEELVHTEYLDGSHITTSVGSATLSGESGQTTYAAIKLNQSGYVELSPKTGSSFAAGDSLIITMFNVASSAKTTGYKIAGTDYTASMPSRVNYTFRRKLIAADIVSSKVKIERESDNGSNAYFVSAIIKHCEDLPSCTTPTLPTLSNQTVCPGSDIAAWDATPTNIATITGASEDVEYSWKKKGSDTELVATASFDLGSSATEGMAGTYVVTVTVSKTGYISKSASAEVDLTVTPATETPSVTASKAKVYATDEVTLTATCGSTGVTWNWYLCANSDGTGAGSSLGTSATYTIASAPAAGTYYYKAVATGDGTHSCGTAEYVYTLVVSAANSCDKEFWFAKEADRPTGAAAATHITGCPSGSSSASYTASIDGTNYTLTGSTGQKTGNVTIVVPADNTGTLYVVVQGSSSRTITLSKGGTQIGQETPENSTWGVFTFDNLDAGTYTLVSSGNISWAMMALKLCPTVACTDDTPTAAATNATVCAGGTITITATGYETGATFQWQKQNASTSVWENIDGATSDTYTVATAAAEHAGNYHIVANKTCARTSNTVTIAVPSAPVFNSFTTTRRIMETQALSISDVSATDAVSYTWYKSADATWDAGDEEIGDSRSLLKAYDGEAAGSTYYVICRAANSCGTTTSSAITVTVQTLVEEDCAIVGNSGEHNTFAKTGSVSSGTYGSIAELHTNSNNKYIYYTAESGYYFATATVNACVGNASDLPTAAYSYSTDGGANWTDQNLTGMTTAYTDHVINLPANVNAFRVGRRLGDCGISSNTIYIHQVCFTYNENCTKTTVDPSSSSVDYEIGDSFTEPTFTVKSSGVALSPQPTITYTSSDETVATVDDDGTVNFQDKAGTVVITAAYAGDATYCDSEGSYTITVSCSDEAPKIIAADGTNIGGCNDNITLEAKKQNGTSDFSDGTYQWYRDGEAISGATGRTYTVSLTGVYSVERTSVGGCVSPSSNKATVTSESAEPEVERLTPFQYYHLDSVYRETSIMRFRHLFAVKNAGTTLEGKHFKMELSRNGGAATDVTNSNAFVMSADTVLLDLNKMYGKYEEDDELVLTCSAVDCEGNVSSIYKNTITIYVIDETPTLALICSGASGDGTRKTSNLVVGGDFLTGYNKADLCVQTGNTSFDKTQEWVLYTRLKENYIVTPVNGYAEFNKLNYEPFDILFLTDYPKASKSDAAATILDDMADLCDYRPLFTFKTHMVHKSPSKWAAKGFMAQPEVPKQSRLRLNIVCYAHPMFDDLKETSDHIQKDAGDHSQIVYTMLTGPGHEGSKGMQGFPIDAAEGFVTIGLVHDDATAADDTPSDGYVTWTSGNDDVMLVAAAERQVNLEARMILFSINCGAQSKLTETGRQVVLKSLEYLLSDATITPVADCSFTFTNGAGNSMSASEYASKCPACTGTKGDGKWSTAANWGPDWILQPGKDTEVKIAAHATVDMPHAKVRTVRILEGGSIDIPVGSGLEVKSTIRRMDGSEISPTEENDIHIGSGASGNGTLIFNNNDGETKARVDMYSTAKADMVNMSAATSTWQYIGTPHSDVANARYNYYNSWLYQYSGSGWEVIPNGGPLVPFRGYCVTHPDAPVVFSMEGTLAATGTVDIDIPAGKYVVVANSWVAPIDINTIEDDDMEGITDKSIYFFNTGSDTDGSGTSTVSATGDARWAAGTYVSVPIHSAPYTDGSDDHIPSMQGFYVVGGSSDGALHLDYDKHVRGQGRGSILSGRMHAPRRTAAESDEPNVLKIFARGSRYDDRLIVLEREDFTRGYDSGWDGEAWGGSDLSPMVYVTGDGREDAVSAIPEFEGTVVAFKAGEDSEYRFEFTYSEDAEPLYLFDTENNTYTQIMTGNAYYFTTADKAPHSRFILTRQAPQITTGCEYLNGSEGAKAKKLIIEDKMYIMLNGALYDATGKAVK